jgi:hypothetical protein
MLAGSSAAVAIAVASPVSAIEQASVLAALTCTLAVDQIAHRLAAA